MNCTRVFAAALARPCNQLLCSTQVWRVGLMGANAQPANVQLVVAAFREGLAAQGWKAGNAAAS